MRSGIAHRLGSNKPRSILRIRPSGLVLAVAPLVGLLSHHRTDPALPERQPFLVNTERDYEWKWDILPAGAEVLRDVHDDSVMCIVTARRRPGRPKGLEEP